MPDMSANQNVPESSGSSGIQAPETEAGPTQTVTFETHGTLEPGSAAVNKMCQNVSESGDASHRGTATRGILRAFESARVPNNLQDAGETHYLEQLDGIHQQHNQRLERGSAQNSNGKEPDRSSDSSRTLDSQTPVTPGTTRTTDHVSIPYSTSFIPSNLAPASAANAPGPHSGNQRPTDGDLDVQTERLLSSIEREHAHSRDDRDDEYYEDDTSRKRRRVFESDMPWFVSGTSSIGEGNPAAAPTRKIISDLGHNASEAKRFLLITPNLPASFPSSEWDNVLAGQYVNFDVVYGAVRYAGAMLK
ncbi:hypothetical protein H0H92_010460 [Tricholoma furcatifolium]|nr:hypothetical protein H0H92_010460 [Tricholoma furcatifolium]